MAKGIVFWTPERVDKIREMLREGKSYGEIAKYFGKSVSAVKFVAFKHGIKANELRKTKNSSHKINRKKKDENLDIAKRLMELQNLERKPEEIKLPEFTEEQMKKWIEDYSSFIKDVCKVELQKYQKEMIEKMKNHNRVVIACGRGSGKTFTTALFVLSEAVINPDRKIVVVGPSLRQSKEFFDSVLRFIAASEVLYNSVVKTRSGNEFFIEFSNGSQIRALPCSEKGNLLRGIRADIIIVEEAAFVPEEIWPAILPFLAVSKTAKLIAISTPGAKSGKFYKMFISPGYEKMQLPTHVNKYVNEEFLKQMEEELDSESYRREVLAEFTEESGLFFTSESIDKCCADYDFLSFPVKGNEYFLGIDWGRKNNASVLVIVEKNKEGLLRVVYVKEFCDKPFPEQIEFIKNLHKHWKFKKIAAEYVGLGVPPTEELIKEGLPVEKIETTIKKKEEIYLKLKKEIEDCKITLPVWNKCPKLIHQLKHFGFEITPNGRLKLHHVSEMIGDDYCDALAFAVYVARKSHIEDIDRLYENLKGLDTTGFWWEEI